MGSPAMKSLLNRQKAELLKATYEIRLAMAARFAREQLDRRLNSLRREIGALWEATNQSEARRRELIFERWDECEEPGPAVLPGFDGEGSELDKARVDSGTEARETIESWVRKKLPKGSDIAYTSEELRLLNSRRHSKKAFAPYE